jgi:hypothetical protein
MDCLHFMAPSDEEIVRFALDEDPLSQEAREHLEQCKICQQRLARYKQSHTSLLSRLYRSQCPSGTRLSLYCAGLLAVDEQMSIAAHLLLCPLCAAEAADTRLFMADVEPIPAPVFSSSVAVQRIVAILIRQQAQLVERNGGKMPEKAWPRQYRAGSINLSLSLSRASNGENLLLGILSSADSEESVDAFDEARAELYSIESFEERQSKTPLRGTVIEDLGNIMFTAVPVGQYVLVIHLPGCELVFEEISIEPA